MVLFFADNSGQHLRKSSVAAAERHQQQIQDQETTVVLN